jgi:hypothetical protein
MTENGYVASVIASDHGAESLRWDLLREVKMFSPKKSIAYPGVDGLCFAQGYPKVERLLLLGDGF